MPRVYIPNDNDHDYSSAEKFGELTALTIGPVNKYNIPDLLTTLRKRMAASEASDYIMVNGLALLVGMAVAIQAQKFGAVNLLQYTNRGYLPAVIPKVDVRAA